METLLQTLTQQVAKLTKELSSLKEQCTRGSRSNQVIEGYVMRPDVHTISFVKVYVDNSGNLVYSFDFNSGYGEPAWSLPVLITNKVLQEIVFVAKNEESSAWYEEYREVQRKLKNLRRERDSIEAQICSGKIELIDLF